MGVAVLVVVAVVTMAEVVNGQKMATCNQLKLSHALKHSYDIAAIQRHDLLCLTVLVQVLFHRQAYLSLLQ